MQLPMLSNGRALIFTFPGTQVRITEHERLSMLWLDEQPPRMSPVRCCPIQIIYG